VRVKREQWPATRTPSQNSSEEEEKSEVVQRPLTKVSVGLKRGKETIDLPLGIKGQKKRSNQKKRGRGRYEKMKKKGKRRTTKKGKGGSRVYIG